LSHLLPNPIWLAGAVLLADGFGSVGAAGAGAQWRLGAHVPVVCTIIAVDHLAEEPADLAITTTCNAERFQLVLQHGTGQASLRAARSSAGPVQINGGAVTISSVRPGEAITTIALTAPIYPEQLSVTLQPL
jgi:hypothetical protein